MIKFRILSLSTEYYHIIIYTIFTIIPIDICGFYLAIYLSMSPKCRKAEHLEKFGKRDSSYIFLFLTR